MERVRELHRPWSVVPDRTILFSIDPALAVDRCLSRGEACPSAPKGPEKFEREEFLRVVAENFKTLARLEPRRFVVIDASRPIAEVLAETAEALAEVLAEG
jgi:dTMP kinase